MDGGVAGPAMAQQVHKLKITVPVTNVAGDMRAGEGEWGYSALVEVDGHRILYDTGASADMVLRNARVAAPSTCRMSRTWCCRTTIGIMSAA